MVCRPLLGFMAAADENSYVWPPCPAEAAANPRPTMRLLFRMLAELALDGGSGLSRGLGVFLRPAPRVLLA
ncbi:hypothetical protein FRAHR75_270040 [Frankia sp. Hr75.2]|nr:hypothetical protein FRAHR75_270040 [Frankia sp. Hr75.2]SQD96857.1 hypothetical protein FMEAI12_3780021 [Parafrankia sp. Ea1.12]